MVLKRLERFLRGSKVVLASRAISKGLQSDLGISNVSYGLQVCFLSFCVEVNSRDIMINTRVDFDSRDIMINTSVSGKR